MWTSLKRPNSGCPTVAQPSLARASLSTSAHETCLSGQPSARAIGSHIAITSGVRTIDGFSSGTYCLSAAKFSIRPQSELAGDQTVGFSRPAAIRACASPDATLVACTKTGRPSTSVRDALKRRTRSGSSGSFSGE